jgi:hypothetical protein
LCPVSTTEQRPPEASVHSGIPNGWENTRRGRG